MVKKIDGVWYYRFASHPRFPYWCLNMIQRKRMLEQASMFLKQNPGEAHYSVEQLQQMAESGSARSRKQIYLVTLQILQEDIATGINQEMT